MDGMPRVGATDAHNVVELPGVRETQDLIAGGAAALEAARQVLESGSGRRPLASVKLLAPLVPSTILCSGSNYHDHNKEKAGAPLSGKEPEFFVKTADCVIGTGDTIIYDERLTKKLDAETELAIVIGKPGRHIPVERALDHVFGYTVANDVTARERQVRRNEQGFTWYEVGRGKAFETAAPLGPWIVTADETGDPQRLRLRTRVNGELRQSASTGNMIFTCAHLIHFFSISFTLKPGFVILTGTPGGTAWSTDPELGGKWVGGDGSETLVPAKGYLKPGDVIENEIEKIGVLRNTVGVG
jgi:2-keto-4-pentenoate hydratase/2-oxohepta-3-ene-1,7-dioic acid hydratase in catechol pathway